jgi:hypothetical protein
MVCLAGGLMADKKYVGELALDALEYFRSSVEQRGEGIVLVSSRRTEEELVLGFITLLSAFTTNPVFGGEQKAMDMLEEVIRNWFLNS